jgi:hypothetical protein
MTPEQELQLKHVEFLQAIINRLAQNSFIVKGWSVTLFAAIFAFLETQNVDPTAYMLPIIPALIFWGLDSYYLRQERLFRHLYAAVADDIRLSAITIPMLSTNTAGFVSVVHSWPRTLLSKTIWPVPFTVIAICLLYMTYILSRYPGGP